MKDQLKQIANKAKEIAVGISHWTENQFDYTSIDEEGNVEVHFSKYYCGESEHGCISLTEEDLIADVESAIIKHRKIAEEKQKREQELKLAKEKKQEEIRKRAKERAERKTYERLKLKFESDINS